MKTIKVTNQELFSAKSVDANYYACGRNQNVSIHWVEGGSKFYQEWDGEVGQYDYEDEFGFQIVND